MAEKNLIFTTEGPLPLPVTKDKGGRRITKEDINAFWEKAPPGIKDSVGCYVFALRAGGGITPYYVGQAKKGFGQEVFTAHKLHRYLDTLARIGKGTPVMFFIVHPRKQGKNNEAVIKQMEKFLIAAAAATNPRIANVQGIAAPSWGIQGVLRSGQGKPSTAARAFRSCMGL